MLFGRFAGALGALASSVGRRTDLEPDLGTVLAGNKDLSQYYALIKKYPTILLQLPNYSGVTIVAPSNAAFDNIPYTALNGIWDPTNETTTVPLLQYHILTGTVATKSLAEGVSYVEPTLLIDPQYTNVTTGQNVVVNKQDADTVVFTTSIGTRCTVTESDIAFQGGLVQVVDNLLIPPADIAKTAEAFQIPSFLGGLYAADLMPNVSYAKNVTIFAPSNAAFDLVGGTLEGLDDDALARVMGYHVVPDLVLVSTSLTNGSLLDTLADDANGAPETLIVRQAGNNKYVNSAQIIQPDILIANGIMHIISDVLNPDDAFAIPDPTVGTQPPVFAASTARGEPFTSALPCTSNCPVTSTTGLSSGTTPTPSSDLFTSESDGAAAPARCTAHVAGAALGALGLGAGMAWL